MADSNLNTSISAIRTKILNDTPTATVDELVSLSRAAKSIGLTEDTSIETAINSRANTLSSNANTNDMVKLANTIKQLRNTTAGAVSPSTTSVATLNIAPSAKYARLSLTSQQSLSSNSTTFVTNFNTRVTDNTTNNLLTSTLGDGKFIIPAGVSKVKLKASLETASASDQIILQIRKNGSNLPGSTNFDIQSTGGDYVAGFTAILDVVENDYFQIAVFTQTSATAEVDVNYSWFELEVIEGSILNQTVSTTIELEDLANVDSSSATQGQVLTWDSANSYWYASTLTVFGNPTITSVSPNNFDGSSGTVITIQGTNFDVGTVVSFIDANGVETNASATSIVTQAEVTATIPQAYTTAEGPLDVKVTIGDGQTITSTDAIQTGGSPIWTTAAGQVGSSLYKDQTGVSLQIEATDPDGQFVSYEVGSGSLAPGLSLAAGTGLITGDITTASITADTNYSFTANANDTAGNSTPRTFFINVLNSGDPIYYTYRVSWGAAASGGDWGHDYGRSPSGSYISGDAYRSDATIAWGGTTDPHSVWGSGSAVSLSSLYDTNWGSSGSFDIGVYVHSGSYSGRSTGTNYMDTITFTSRSIDGGVHILQSGDAAKLTNPNENFNALQGDTVYVTVKLP